MKGSHTRHAFAAVRNDGTVITWGHPQMGGDSSAVREQLIGVACLILLPAAQARQMPLPAGSTG